MRFWAWIKSFQGIIWVGCVLIVGYLLVWPLVQNVWAYYFWERVPCVVFEIKVKVSNHQRIFFMHDKQAYYTARHDFWQTESLDPIWVQEIPIGGKEDVLYTSRGKHFTAVYRLDAHKHFGRATRQFTNSGLVVAVCAMLSFVTRPRTKKSSSAPFVSS